MNSIIIATDLHNTLVNSNDAWISAFSIVSGRNREEIALRINNKESRHGLSESLGISYDEVYMQYRNTLTPNMRVVNALKDFSSIGVPIIVISSAPYDRMTNDLHDIKNMIPIDRAYSRDQFSKSCRNDWDKLMALYECNQILYFGNDQLEDNISHEKVLSVIICQ